MSFRPHERALLLDKSVKGIDSFVDEVIEDADGKYSSLYEKTKALNKSKVKKSYVESCLLASNDLEKISRLLEIPEKVLWFYRKIFFDVLDIDRLTKLEHIDTLRDKNEANMKLWALSLGLDFLAWRLGHQVNISPVEGLNDLFSTCIYKSKEAVFNQNASDASKESTKWVKLSLDIARLLKIWVMDSEGARKDLELALQEVIPSFKSLDDLDGEFNFEEKE